MSRGIGIFPRVGTGLLTHRHRMEAPLFAASFRIKRHYETAYAPVAPGGADKHKTLPGNRRRTEEFTPGWVGFFDKPKLLAGLGIQCKNSPITRAAKQPPIEIRDTTIDGVDLLLRRLVNVSPFNGAVARIQRDGAVGSCDIQGIVDDQRARMKGAGVAKMGFAHSLESIDVCHSDLSGGRESLAVVTVVIGGPRTGRLVCTARGHTGGLQRRKERHRNACNRK